MKRRIDMLFATFAAITVWVIIASAARGDSYLATISAAGLLLIVLMALPDEPEAAPRCEDDEPLYLDQFEVLRREATRKEAA